MPISLPEINYTNSKSDGPIVDADTSYYILPYFKDTEFFSNPESYVNFVKGIEKMVRNNDRYKKYISYLKKEVKLNRCQILKDITDEDATIEMHHGPIFTLFDVCAIVLEYFLIKKWKISTLRIADTVLNEHQQNRVQVVMVSKTMHETIHDGDIFINTKQAWGDLNAFIKKYKDAINDEYREQINRYVDRSLLHDSEDFSILKLNEALVSKK